MSISILDISALVTTSALSQQHNETAKALIDSISINGVVGITGHGLPPDLSHSLFSHTKDFFRLSHEEKLQVSSPASAGSGAPPRGFTEAGIEHAGKSFEEKEGKPKLRVTAADYKVWT